MFESLVKIRAHGYERTAFWDRERRGERGSFRGGVYPFGEKRDTTMPKNNVQKLREAQLMSKAELARKAGLSALTIERVERGKPCRMDTKRKILLALGLKPSDRMHVFMEEGEDSL